ncbi:ATP-binding cassette subfamily F protein 3 [Rhodobium orientis]|uniref:Glycosyl transferase family 1 n=1 Tax=Rhodobium orientis TaxID=34017 RepID=A0A327JPA9_9HYPH|nr:ABC-F family ATP-binding cassette domain-containing protein [Rhodobium orientis]MBB4302203.1 ATP-binding cassette subfamily F protein 3 [Rhodobium orientis]MBK5948914.1 glycosyl transferase family 1 [Rhodobium orientis]RAI27901.1 glycosyl transferase family 1 [Rhodobium orientis]
MLRITDLTYRIAGRMLLDAASARIPDGAKIGLVGKNGTGKTTLFRLVAGDAAPESGEIVLRKGARIGGVAQEAPGGPQRLIDFVLAADTERAALMAEAETATDPHRIADIHTRLADIDAHGAEARTATILAGLGFDEPAQQRPCSDFSGGWRMRVALAAALFSAPDLLLLDEPTNYLDLEGTLWLEAYIARYPHTVLLISHDRDLLNSAVDGILHLETLKLFSYRGGYDQFERQRREKMLLNEKAREKAEAQKKHMEAFVERFRYKASKARQAQSRLKMIAKLEPIAAMVDDSLRPFEFPNPDRQLSPPIIAMENVAVGYEPGKAILKGLSLRVDDDDRIALLGPNGNGKSTFAKLISGRLKEQSGTITTASKLDVAYFAQHQLDELVPSQSAVDHVRALMPDATEPKVRARVARFGLPTDRMETPAGDLSGGEKARLLLGLVTFSGPHLLVLDEPTNHLDVDAREALVQALAEYSGAVLIISHDRHLIEASSDRLWLVADGTVKAFDGDMADYRRQVLKKPEKGDSSKANGSAEANGDRLTGQEKRKAAAARRAEMAPLKRDIDRLEKDIEKLNAKIADLDGRLADPDLFASDPDAGARLAKERSDTAARLAATEETWLEKSADYEEAMAEV